MFLSWNIVYSTLFCIAFTVLSLLTSVVIWSNCVFVVQIRFKNNYCTYIMTFSWSFFSIYCGEMNLHNLFPSYYSPHPTLLFIPLPSSKAGSGGNQASGSVFLSCRSPQVPTCQYTRQRLGSAVAQLTSSPTATTQGAPVPLPAQRQARSTPAPPILLLQSHSQTTQMLLSHQ